MTLRLATKEDVPLVAEMLDEATAYVRMKGSDQWRLPFPQDELRGRVARGELKGPNRAWALYERRAG